MKLENFGPVQKAVFIHDPTKYVTMKKPNATALKIIIGLLLIIMIGQIFVNTTNNRKIKVLIAEKNTGNT